MNSRFSAITRKIQMKLPTWFKMRKDPKSIGAQFLNVTGLALEEVTFLLDEAVSNLHIGTAKIDQIDIVYKAPIPSALAGFQVEFVGDGYLLQEAPSLDAFFRGYMLSADTGTTPELFYENYYLVDKEHNVVYLRKQYGQKADGRDGAVIMKLMKDGLVIDEPELPIYLHHVWNYFDEWGLMLDCPRLYAERNREYKERLLSVFRFPAGAHKQGLINGILRDLGLTRTITWENGGTDLLITDSRVDLGTIVVDGGPWPADRASVDASGRTVLKGYIEKYGVKRSVRYAYGIELLRLNDKLNTAFQIELHNLDGSASRVLNYYVSLISQQVPLKWGEWRWDDGFWDMARADLSGNGVLPAFSDASVTGWRRYN